MKESHDLSQGVKKFFKSLKIISIDYIERLKESNRIRFIRKHRMRDNQEKTIELLFYKIKDQLFMLVGDDVVKD